MTDSHGNALVRAAADLPGRPADGPILSTTDDPPVGFEVTRVFGLVRGNTIRARNVGQDIVAVLRAIVGGEIVEYTKLMAEAREQSLDRMRAEARARGANGVLGVRFTTSMVMGGAAEILVYGTAVLLKPKG